MAGTRALLVLTVLVAAACGDDEVGIDTDQASGGVTGAAATWAIAENDPPTSDAESFTAMVERLGCSGGETGEVLEPSVAADELRAASGGDQFVGDDAVIGHDFHVLEALFTQLANQWAGFRVQTAEEIGRAHV